MLKDLEILIEKKNTLSKKYRKLENENINLSEDFVSELKNNLIENSIDCKIKIEENKIFLSFPSNSFYSKIITIERMGGKLYLRVSSFTVSTTDSDPNNLNYYKTVCFLSQFFLNEENDFIKKINNFIIKYYTNTLNLKIIKRDITNINNEINIIENNIKKEKFFNNLKSNDFYYSYKELRYSPNHYDIYYIKKINNKTCNIVKLKARNENDIKIHINNIENYPQKRIRKDDLFYLLLDYGVFNSNNFKEVILKNNIKNNVEKMYKQKDLHIIKDMKELCRFLFKLNVIDKNVPDNDTLSIISEIRHRILKYGYVK